MTESNLKLIPELNYYGEIHVNLYVSDGELSDSTSFIVYVSAENDLPQIIDEIGYFVVEENSEDIEINLSDYFYDIENTNNLTYLITENIEALITNLSNNILILFEYVYIIS